MRNNSISEESNEARRDKSKMHEKDIRTTVKTNLRNDDDDAQDYDDDEDY